MLYVGFFFVLSYSIGFSVAPQWDWSLIREDNILLLLFVPSSSKEYDGLFKDKRKHDQQRDLF